MKIVPYINSIVELSKCVCDNFDSLKHRIAAKTHMASQGMRRQNCFTNGLYEFN